MSLAELVTFPQYSAATSASDALKEQIQASEIINVTPSEQINATTKTPIAVRFIKIGDLTPTCGLVFGPSKSDIYELVSPAPGGDLPACGTPLKKPEYFEHSGPYLVYEYMMEDPHKQFTKMYQLIKVTPSGIQLCDNDDQLTDAAKKKMKVGPKKAFELAMEKYGCKPHHEQ